MPETPEQTAVDPEAIRARLSEEPAFVAELGAFAGRAYALGARYFEGRLDRVYATPEDGITLATTEAAHMTKELFLIAANGWASEGVSKLNPEKVAGLIDDMKAEDEATGKNEDPTLRVMASERAIYGYRTPLQSMHRFGDV